MRVVIGDLDLISDKQIALFEAKTKYTAFGGARGGGKSWAVRAKAKMLCLRYPGIKLLIVRKTYQELISNHVKFLRPELHGIAKYNKSDKEFTFFNGSTIKLGYCANDSDLDQYQGTEYDIIFIDEATNLKEEWLKKITACMRGTNGLPKRTYYTCNPGGPAHGYIKRVFIDRHFEAGENPEDYSFIQSLVTDNKALMKEQPDYIKQLEALPPKLRAAWLEGRWDIFEGQFFEDFRVEPDLVAAEAAGFEPDPEMLKEQGRFTHVIAPLDLSKGERRNWKIFRSYDFGYGKPFSCAWWAYDYDGILYRILELYGCTETPNEGIKWTPDQQFAEIAKIEREHPWLRGKHIEGVADPSIWDVSHGISIADTAMKHQVFFQPGDNERLPGWMQCHYRLQFDENGFPRMYVFENCKAFIRTVPTLMFSQTRPEDLDTTLEDHVADEWRYMCMARPIAPMRPVEEKKEMSFFSDPLNLMNNERR